MERREFMKGAAAIAGAPAFAANRGANDRIGIAHIGVGTRGEWLQNWYQGCANTELRVISDLYEGNIARAVKASKNEKVKVERDWEKAIANPDVDVVVISTPDFWHAPMAIRAAQMKKDVYVEKGLCRTLDEAKAIRKAVRENKVILQLGHHQNSEPGWVKAREIFQSGRLGKTPLARTYIDRTNPYPEWQFYTRYDVNTTPAEANQNTIDWKRFIANAPKRDFDVERFFKWRCYWDYGTGIAGDLMSHQWDGVNLILGLGIPESVITQGGLYFWKEDRDVPDMWHVTFDYPKKEMAVSFGCSFHNRHMGTFTQILGREGTLDVDNRKCRLYPAEWKSRTAPQPEYDMQPGEVTISNHMQNFIDCVRNRETPRCGMDRAFEEAVTIVMSVESYRRERKVKWDAVKEQIV